MLPALLGLGLAASAGLKTFVPLLVMAVAARFHLFGVELSDAFAWLGSWAALAALSVATLAEVAADKIPLVDHALSLVGTVARPVAGAVAAAAAFSGLDPTTAAVAGLIVGAPTALAVHAGQATTRVVSTATTGGWRTQWCRWRRTWRHSARPYWRLRPRCLCPWCCSLWCW